jgi:hypothetical protein
MAAKPASTPARPAAAHTDGSNGLNVLALVLGGLGLAAGVAGLAVGRRRPATA